MPLFKCGHCGSKTIMQSLWNQIPILHCVMCGECEESEKGIYSVKTGKRAYSYQWKKIGYKAKLEE